MVPTSRSAAPRPALALGAAILTLLSGAARAQAPAWTPAERTLAVQALAQAGETDAAALDDAGLEAALVRQAVLEAGQRVRPESVDRLWAIAPAPRDMMGELTAARRRGELAAWLKTLAPSYPEYLALAQAARRYQGIAATGGWAALPAGPTLKPGQRHPQAALLRSRLAREGYKAAAPADPTLFDAALAAQLAAFQRAHGLAGAGRLDAATRAALNVSAEDRLDQIEANLERWRWLPRQLPAERIDVDVAGESVRALQADCEVLNMKAVVGDPRHQTPMFASRIDGVTFNPPWNVPADIAQAEILPKAAKDPGYLAANDFVITDGRVRQKAGPKSALGQIKFDLPSPFGVYLHDTPAKGAFARPLRDLSHGCMRLEKPTELAVLLLARQGWTAARVQAAIAGGKTETVALKTPVPLYVLYWTAVVDPAGKVDFRPDVYGWDRKLVEALADPDVRRVAASAGD